MHKLIFIMAFLIISITSSSQHVRFPDSIIAPKRPFFSGYDSPGFTNIFNFNCPPSSKYSTPVLIVVEKFGNSNELNHFIFTPLIINKLEVLKSKEAVKRFGAKAKSGALIFKLNDSVHLESLTNLLDYFNIPDDMRQLDICVDGYYIPSPKKILAHLASVKSVMIEEGNYLRNAQRIETPKKFINIKRN